MLAVDIGRKIARSIYGIGIGIGITRIPCAREQIVFPADWFQS